MIFDRRTLLERALLSSIGLSVAGRAEAGKRGAKHLIVLWAAGGPSQIDTFDPKKGETGGPFQPIKTSLSGVKVTELLPTVAKQLRHAALIRSMTSREGNHVRASHLSLTGYVPGGVKHPTVGSVLSARRPGEGPLPSFVSIGARQLTGGYLGSEHAPFNIRNAGRVQETMVPAVRQEDRLKRRLTLLDMLDDRFERRQASLAQSHSAVRRNAVRLMRSDAKKAFDIFEEPQGVREAYGDNRFGRGVLAARRLIERGVRVVQVEQRGWDTHKDNFDRTKRLAGDLDRALGALLGQLKASGLLEETLVVWMGEFGRTPRINANQGRDHYPRAYSALLAGGGIKGGQVIGRTSDDGGTVLERPVTVPELLATVYHCFGIPPDLRIGAPRGRPIDAVPSGIKPIAELI